MNNHHIVSYACRKIEDECYHIIDVSNIYLILGIYAVYHTIVFLPKIENERKYLYFFFIRPLS